jgi:AraC-like DNA-binding protein
MKKIIQHYGADLEWVDSLAKQLDGKIDGNFIIVPETIHTGNRYFLNCEEGIVALYVDVTYNTDLYIIQKNLKDDFIGLYFNLSEAEAKLSFDTLSNMMGIWSFNLSLIDSSLGFEFDIKEGSKVFIFCIFIKKELIRKFSTKNKVFSKNIDLIIDPKKNTFIHWDRMSYKSFHALIDLRKLEVGTTFFDLNMIGTVNLLISEYLNKTVKDNVIIKLVNELDLSNIILSQRYLIENLENNFPGIKYLATKANMSESKFKVLFKKITGNTPNSFFIENKLYKAKELLEEKQLSITQIAKQLNFGDCAYFASKFKKKFGILPKTYSKQL